MAAGKESAAERRAREEAQSKALEAEAGPDSRPSTSLYGRQLRDGETPAALVASAARIDLNDKATIAKMRRRRQAWQTEAWDYFDEVGEIGYTVTFLGNLMSKLRLFPAVRPNPEDAPMPVTDEASQVPANIADIAVATIERLRSSQGGQSAILRESSMNFEVAGEALDTSTLVVTPDGFTPMGDLVEGDVIIGGDGRPCRVVRAHPIREDRECYEVRLSGGVSVVADGEHLWVTHPQRDRQYRRQWGRAYEPTVLTTAQMADTLCSDAAGGTARNHAIELAGMDGAEQMGTEIDPYVLGYWLGDGTATQGNITVHPDDQPHLRERVESAGYVWSPRMAASGRGFQIGVRGLQTQLRRAGLLGQKHVPPAYLRAPEADRWALLQGLIDSDGYIDKNGRVEFSNINQRLLWDVVELAASLGLRPSRPGKHRVWFNSAGHPVALLPRKAERITPAKERDRWRYVQSVDLVKSRPVRCITVDSSDGTFLVTPHFVRTHNCYLHGHIVSATEAGDDVGSAGAEDWQIRSVDELGIQGDHYVLRVAPGARDGKRVPVEDLVIRLWERHPRFSEMATCAMRRILPEAEALLLLSREIRATAKSRLSNGLLLVPSEISFGAADPTREGGSGEETDDPFDADLQEAMITPIQDEGSASAVVPLVIRAQSEYLEKIRHVSLTREMDKTLDERIEARVMRIARGLNMPVEVTTGLQATTFANAAQVKQSEFDSHVEPRAILLVDALTAGYFQPALIEAGVPREVALEMFVWFDASAIVAQPDQAEQSAKAHEDGLISDEARRRYIGYPDTDAPSDEEMLRRILFQAARRMDPNLMGQLLKITGIAPTIEVPPSTSSAGTAGPEQMSLLTPEEAQEAVREAWEEVRAIEAPILNPDALVASRARDTSRNLKRLGTRLAGIDRDLRARITIAAEAAMKRAMERAGNRIKSKTQRQKGGEASTERRIAAAATPALVAAALGPTLVAAVGLTDEELLDGAFTELGDEVGAWIDVSGAAALEEIDRALDGLTAAARLELDARRAQAATSATDWLAQQLAALAKARLYDPAGGTLAAVGEQGANATIPAWVVRAAVSMAGGGQPTGGAGTPLRDSGGGPLAGLATGPISMDAVSAGGGAIEAYVWDYGSAPRVTFEPHEALDGEMFDSFEDDLLVNDEGWPDAPFFFPGDHDGCVCDVTPVIVSQEGTVEPEVPTGEAA